MLVVGGVRSLERCSCIKKTRIDMINAGWQLSLALINALFSLLLLADEQVDGVL